MKKDDKYIISLLPKYFKNEAEKSEIKQITGWVEESEGNRMVFDEIRDVWFAMTSEKERESFDTEKAWEKYSAWIDEQHSRETGRGNLRKFVMSVLRYASVILITLLVSYLVLFRSNEKSFETKPFIVEIPKGQTGSVTLYDGTAVMLNSGSRLVCDSYKSKTERRVSFTGEGYFKVAHNPDVPFFVDVKNISLKVYGTEFNVYAYGEDDFVKTTLINGKVGVLLPDGKEYLLKPDEMLLVNSEESIKLKKVNPSESVSWMKGYYKFKDETIEEISKHIERMYNVDVVFDSKGLKSEKFTGRINKSEKINIVMQKLQMTSNFILRYKIKGDTIHIYKN